MKTSDRKHQLIAEGHVYRAEILIARDTVQRALQPETLARHVAEHVATKSLSLFRSKTGLAISGDHLQSLLPVLLQLFSTFSRNKALLPPALRGPTVAAIGAIALAYLMRRAKRRTPSHPE